MKDITIRDFVIDDINKMYDKLYPNNIGGSIEFKIGEILQMLEDEYAKR